MAPLVRQIRGGPNVSPRITDRSYTEGATEGTTERRYGRSAAAVVQVNGQGQLAAIMAITPSVDMSLQAPRPRLLVSFIKLDAAYWQEAGRELLLPDLGYGQPSGERRGDYQLKTDTGQLLATLTWTPRRPGLLLMKNVPDAHLRQVYRRRMWKMLRSRPNPGVMFVSVVKCATHYHHYTMSREMSERRTLVNTF